MRLTEVLEKDGGDLASVDGKDIIKNARLEGRSLLTELESKRLVEFAGITVVHTELAKTKDEAISIGARLNFSLAMKIISPDIVHKSDSGGVRLNVKTPQEIAEAYDAIVNDVRKKHPGLQIDGISIQNMAPPGIEVIVGMFEDEQFGPVLMFGLGGVWVEILEDVSFRIVPIERKDASSMIKEIKGHKLLKGHRGQEGVHIESLESLLMKLSEFVQLYPEIKEIDLNPILAYSNGYITVDARMVLHDKQ